MSVHLHDCATGGAPTETQLQEPVTLRLIEDSEREHFDEKLSTKRQHLGCPVLAMETFVDPQRFHGACYKAAALKRNPRSRLLINRCRHGVNYLTPRALRQAPADAMPERSGLRSGVAR